MCNYYSTFFQMTTRFRCFTPYDIFSGFFFLPLRILPTPHILMGNNTIMTICGKGSIGINDGTFHDVLCVPSLSSNLLCIYQITHSSVGKTVEFARDSIYIRDSDTSKIIATGTVDHSSHLYSSYFGPPYAKSETLSFFMRDY